MTEDVKGIVKQIEDEVKKCCGSSIGGKVTEATRNHFCETLAQLLAQYVPQRGIVRDAIAFEVDPTDSTLFIPSNLYTVLLLRGVIVDYEEVKDKTEYRVPENYLYYGGCTFRYYPPSSSYEIIITSIDRLQDVQTSVLQGAGLLKKLLKRLHLV